MTRLLRAEGAALLVLSLVLYRFCDLSWVLFFVLILVPDVSFAGYAWGNVVGARVYNAVHAYIAPAILTAIGFGWDLQAPRALGLIWLAHISADRMLGFGLKHETGFTDTHLS